LAGLVAIGRRKLLYQRIRNFACAGKSPLCGENYSEIV
jgi:hypothetical protein